MESRSRDTANCEYQVPLESAQLQETRRLANGLEALRKGPQILADHRSYPSSFRLASIAASSFAASFCCSRNVVARRLIFSSNNSPSSSSASAPTYRPGVSTYPCFSTSSSAPLLQKPATSA